MKFVSALLGGLLLAVSPLATLADDMNYSFVELDWINTDVDNGPSGDGFYLDGSVGFADHFFVFADYASQSVDVIDIDALSVGIGGHFGIAENLDLVGRVGYSELDLSAPGFSADADGYLVSAGLRGRVADQFEMEAHIIYRDLGNQGGDETAYSLGGRYHFSDMFAFGAEYQFGEDADTLFAGVRFSF